MRNGIRIRKENETDVKPEITVIMEIVNIEARTFEAMLSAFRTFADRLDTLCRLYGDMEEKKWLDNQEVCLLLKVSPRTLQTLRDNARWHTHRSATRHITSPGTWKVSSG